MTLGSYGEKATPIFGQNKLEPMDHIPAPKLDGKIRKFPPIAIDTEKSSKSNFTGIADASLKPIGAKGGSLSAIYEDLSENRLKLVRLRVEPEDMEREVNNSPKVLERLREYGSDARIVHELFVITEAAFADSFTGGVKFDVSVDALDMLSIKASGGTTVRGKDTIVLAPGTCLAYLLLKPDWNKGKTQIEKFVVDEWSIG
jgi:hypothetical protein